VAYYGEKNIEVTTAYEFFHLEGFIPHLKENYTVSLYTGMLDYSMEV